MRAEAQRDEHGAARPAAHDVGKQLQGSLVGPVQVVEREHDRGARGEQLQQRAQRVVGAVALGLQRRRSLVREAGQDAAEVGQASLERTQRLPSQRVHVVVQRVHEQPERQIALQLGRPTLQDQAIALVGSLAQRGQESRLSDARLAREREHRRGPALELLQQLVEERQLPDPSHDSVRRHPALPSVSPRRSIR
jgi:hypothetical protein